MKHTAEGIDLITFRCGPLETNAYIAMDRESGKALIVEAPPGGALIIAETVRARRATVAAIVLTHGHWDHTADAAKLASLTAAPVMIHHLDEGMMIEPDTYGFPLPEPLPSIRPDGLLGDGDTILLGDYEFRVLHVPGHTPGHIALHAPRAGILFSGDALFDGSIGRTDLPGGSYDALLDSLTKRILTLPEETRVLPGHAGETTIGKEMTSNPFIREYLDFF
ncbi:MAG: MBL fold metallo-hydrolase [Bacteroidota bacterium]|nr:MBL fold metallo-hydrolase [Bacteroidota bacterium]